MKDLEYKLDKDYYDLELKVKEQANENEKL